MLLTEGGGTSAREAITALALSGHAVAYCDPAPICLGRFSRRVSRRYRCPPLGSDPDGFGRFLERVLARDRFDVLVPIHEQGYLVARIADRLRPLVALAAPAFAAYDRIQTKLGFHGLLKQLFPAALPTGEGWLALAAVLDLATRKIVGGPVRSATSRATSAFRRNAPAKPIARMARSRLPVIVSGIRISIAATISAVAAAFRLSATPTRRRMPVMAALTSSSAVELASLPSWCA